MATAATRAVFSTIHHPKKLAFLTIYTTIGKLREACKQVRIDPSQHYYWLQTDPAYGQAWEQAKRMAAHVLEEEAIRRAMGYEETHTTASGIPYQVTKTSDTMLIFLLKGMMPEKYGERIAHTGAKGGPMAIQVVFADPPDTEADAPTVGA